MTLPMLDWVESPAYFCSVTETVTYLDNKIPATTILLPRRLDTVAETSRPSEALPLPVGRPCRQPQRGPTNGFHHMDEYLPPPPHLPPPRGTSSLHPYSLRPIRNHDVYVDDFISLHQESKRRQRQQRRAWLHILDNVIRPLIVAEGFTYEKRASIGEEISPPGVSCLDDGIHHLMAIQNGVNGIRKFTY